MADLTVTAAQVAPVYPNSHTTVIRTYTALVAIAAGQSVYGDPTTGNVGLASANTSGHEQFLGVAINTKAAGEMVSVQEAGEIYGFNLSGINYFGLVFQSDTAGAFADAASGTKTVQVGKVKPINESGTPKKVLYIQADRLRNW